MAATDSQRRAAATGALAYAIVAPATYLLERLYERLREGTRDPTRLISEPHAAFYWRSILAAWAGVVAAIIVYRLAREPLSKRVEWALLALTPLAIAWAVVWP